MTAVWCTWILIQFFNFKKCEVIALRVSTLCQLPGTPLPIGLPGRRNWSRPWHLWLEGLDSPEVTSWSLRDWVSAGLGTGVAGGAEHRQPPGERRLGSSTREHSWPLSPAASRFCGCRPNKPLKQPAPSSKAYSLQNWLFYHSIFMAGPFWHWLARFIVWTPKMSFVGFNTWCMFLPGWKEVLGLLNKTLCWLMSSKGNPPWINPTQWIFAFI